MGGSLDSGPFWGVLVLRVPYYIRDLKRDPNCKELPTGGITLQDVGALSLECGANATDFHLV